MREVQFRVGDWRGKYIVTVSLPGAVVAKSQPIGYAMDREDARRIADWLNQGGVDALVMLLCDTLSDELKSMGVPSHDER